jgi:hypothetical protein
MIENGCSPICVISDFFLGWTLDSCRSLGIPRIVSHGMGLLSMAICKSVGLLAPSVKDSSYLDPVGFPKLKTSFTLLKSDIPEGFLHADPDDDFVRLSLWGRTRGRGRRKNGFFEEQNDVVLWVFFFLIFNFNKGILVIMHSKTTSC